MRISDWMSDVCSSDLWSVYNKGNAATPPMGWSSWNAFFIDVGEERVPGTPAHRRCGNAATPPMGWSSWNAFFTDIDEEKVLGSATKLVSTGLAAKGYRYVNLDDGWWMKRRETDDRLIIRTDKFPSAATKDGNSSFRPFTRRLHAMGLKAGIYSDTGRHIR